MRIITQPLRRSPIALATRSKSGIARMNIEDRAEFVDLVAQAVIDRIEERDRVNGLVHLVVQRVIDLQREEVTNHGKSTEADATAMAEAMATDATANRQDKH